MSYQRLILQELVIDLMWNFCTASKLDNILSALGIKNKSDLEPYNSKKAYLSDVFQKVENDTFVNFTKNLIEYLDNKTFDNLADENKFELDKSSLKAEFLKIKSSYQKKSNINQIFFASTGKPEFILKPETGMLEDTKGSSLVYNGPYRSDGVTNKDLFHWFDTQTIKNQYVSVHERLENSIQTEKEKSFYRMYCELFNKPENLCLFPQAWLNWDAKTKKQRGGTSIIPSQRIDFLIYGPVNCYIIEIDGSSHWSKDQGKSFDSKTYTSQIQSDRKYLLRGFQMIRFSNEEILDNNPDFKKYLFDYFTNLFN